MGNFSSCFFGLCRMHIANVPPIATTSCIILSEQRRKWCLKGREKAESNTKNHSAVYGIKHHLESMLSASTAGRQIVYKQGRVFSLRV